MSLKISRAILGSALAAYAIFLIRGVLLHSPKLDIVIKEIHGLRYVPQSQVLMKLKEIEERNKNLFALDLDQSRKSIERLPWVKEATVRRILPDKLVIYVKERVPIAFAKINYGTVLVDEDGSLLENNPEILSHFDFPVVVGLEEGFDVEALARNKKRISQYRALIRSLNENEARLSQDISEIYLPDPDNVSVILNEDTVLVHLGAESFQEKFRRYLAMSRELKQKYPLLDSVDLRYENQVVVNTANGRITAQARN